jgi:hypothetical protein
MDTNFRRKGRKRYNRPVPGDRVQVDVRIGLPLVHVDPAGVDRVEIGSHRGLGVWMPSGRERFARTS